MGWLNDVFHVVGQTVFDVLPIMVILLGFQALVLREALPHPRRLIGGFVYAVLGLALFLIGLEEALFPLGKIMALQLAEHARETVAEGAAAAAADWRHYGWVYLFAAAIGFSTTVAEPALIAVSLKASEVSGRALDPWMLRVAVAIGVAFGVALGTFRIVTGTPLPYYIMVGYAIVVAQTAVAPKSIIPLAYDSGGVTTSTVTVPLVTALGLGLASTIPGRSPLIDGFGLIAFASLFPMITVMGYAQISAWRAERGARKDDS